MLDESCSKCGSIMCCGFAATTETPKESGLVKRLAEAKAEVERLKSENGTLVQQRTDYLSAFRDLELEVMRLRDALTEITGSGPDDGWAAATTARTALKVDRG